MRGLPGAQILGRELVEIAARRRTYVMRAGVVLLFLAVYGLVVSQVQRLSGQVQWNHGQPVFIQSSNLLGQGAPLVTSLIVLMSIAVSVMIPAMAALSVITERDRGTLVLLVLTPMSLVGLVVQKYLALLVAAGAICLLAVPLMVVGYTLGGMPAYTLATQLAFVVVLACQAAAAGLVAGCMARSTAAAIVMAYVLVVGLHCSGICLRMGQIPWWLYCSPYMLFDPGWPFAERVLAPMGLALAMLAVARVTLPSRLEATTSSRLDRAVKRMDAGFEAIDATLFRRRPQRALADVRPLFWLAVNRSSFCSWRFMIRFLLPAMAGMVLLTLLGDGARTRQIGILVIVLAFFISALLLVIVGVGLVTREGSDQTLDVLLTTQISARDFVRQKMRALARLRWALAGCMAPALGVFWWQTQDRYAMLGIAFGNSLDFTRFHISPWMYAVEIWLSLSIYSWVAVMVGLRCRPVSRAVMLSLSAVLGCFLGVPILQAMLASAGIRCSGDLWAILCIAVSPTYLITNGLRYGVTSPWIDMLTGWLGAIGIWIVLARICHERAERWLAAGHSGPA